MQQGAHEKTPVVAGVCAGLVAVYYLCCRPSGIVRCDLGNCFVACLDGGKGLNLSFCVYDKVSNGIFSESVLGHRLAFRGLLLLVVVTRV